MTRRRTRFARDRDPLSTTPRCSSLSSTISPSLSRPVLAGLKRLVASSPSKKLPSSQQQTTKMIHQVWKPVEGEERPAHLKSLNDFQLKGKLLVQLPSRMLTAMGVELTCLGGFR
jgi:hypothetical protein